MCLAGDLVAVGVEAPHDRLDVAVAKHVDVVVRRLLDGLSLGRLLGGCAGLYGSCRGRRVVGAGERLEKGAQRLLRIGIGRAHGRVQLVFGVGLVGRDGVLAVLVVLAVGGSDDAGVLVDDAGEDAEDAVELVKEAALAEGSVVGQAAEGVVVARRRPVPVIRVVVAVVVVKRLVLVRLLVPPRVALLALRQRRDGLDDIVAGRVGRQGSVGLGGGLGK